MLFVSSFSAAMMTDYHTHTPLCLHASGTARQYVESALAKGLTEYGIADHAPMPDEPFDEWRMKQADLPDYFAWIAEAREHATGTPLAIRCGMECDWIPGIEPWIEHLNTLADWDYLIGSVHYLDDKWAFDDPQSLAFWQRTNVEEAWTRYWSLYADMAKSGLFTIMGHADLIGKFGYKPEGDLTRFYEPAIAAIAESGAALEINTAGWNKPCACQYPEERFLQLALEANIPLLINSDAHAPGELGQHFDTAKELAHRIGFRQLVRIEQKQLIPYPL